MKIDIAMLIDIVIIYTFLYFTMPIDIAMSIDVPTSIELSSRPDKIRRKKQGLEFVVQKNEVKL